MPYSSESGRAAVSARFVALRCDDRQQVDMFFCGYGSYGCRRQHNFRQPTIISVCRKAFISRASGAYHTLPWSPSGDTSARQAPRRRYRAVIREFFRGGAEGVYDCTRPKQRPMERLAGASEIIAITCSSRGCKALSASAGAGGKSAKKLPNVCRCAALRWC